MLVKNNYKECLTNLACSIRKYFELEYKHNTLDYIDKILDEYKPKNVVTILCDGMGSNIMDRMLDGNSFLIKNRIKPITTVFPATTVAATTSMMTGLNPAETGMIGWDIYYKDIDKIISTFLNIEKGDKEEKILQEAIDYNNKHMIRKTIVDEINERGIYKGLYTTSDRRDFVLQMGDIMSNYTTSNDSLCVVTVEPMLYIMSKALKPAFSGF